MTRAPFTPKPFTPGAPIEWREFIPGNDTHPGHFLTRSGQVWSLAQPHGGKAALWAIPDSQEHAAVLLVYRRSAGKVLHIAATLSHNAQRLTIRRADALHAAGTVELTYHGPRKNRLSCAPGEWTNRPVEVHLPGCPDTIRFDHAGTASAWPILAHLLGKSTYAGHPAARAVNFCPNCLGATQRSQPCAA